MRLNRRLSSVIGSLLLVALSTILICKCEAAVMAIDYGTDWFKVALIRPAHPLEIVLNSDSKRKTPSILTVRGDVRSYGLDSYALGLRYPLNTYFSLKKVIGKTFDDEDAKQYREMFDNKMIADPVRNTVAFQHNDTTVFSVEELVAMQFSRAKAQAEHIAGETINDVVITIPPFLNQFERRAILDAADLADLNVLGLIHDETAVALNYISTRAKSLTEQPQYYIFYDMGAGNTVASLISFKQEIKNTGRFNKTVVDLEVKSIGYDRKFGGQTFDMRLRKYLATEFEKAYQDKLTTSVFSSPRAMVKLLKEANRVKKILSANKATVASVENLHENHDFRIRITREEFESLIEDLLVHVNHPIEIALSKAQMTLADVQSVIVVGGGVRIPAIQNTLKNAVGEDKISHSVNGDEAAALGAAFRAASLNRGFRGQEVRIKDVTPYAIEADYLSEPKETPDGPSQKAFHQVLFKGLSPLGVRKLMNFKRTSDFDFTLKYSQVPDNETNVNPANIALTKVSGLAEAIAQFNEVNADKRKVRVGIQLSDSGLITIGEAVAEIEVEPSLTDKFKSFFGMQSNDTDETVKEVTSPEEGTNDTTENSTAPSGTPEAQEPAQMKLESINLKVDIEYIGIPPMGEDEKKSIITRLRLMDKADELRRAREEARNNLEAFTYSLQNFLYDDFVIQVSNEEQRNELGAKLSSISDWLYEDGEAAHTEELKSRLADLQALEKPIAMRRTELLERPKIVELVKGFIQAARDIVTKITGLSADERYHTDEELQELIRLCDSTEEHLNHRLAKQSEIPTWVEPSITVAEIKNMQQEIERGIKVLVEKRPPIKPKTQTATASPDEKSTKESESSSTTEEETVPTETQSSPASDSHDEL